MSGLPDRLRAVLIGIAVVVAVLLLHDLALTLRAIAEQDLSSPLWAVVVMLLVGAIVVYAAWFGRRDPTTPVVAAVLLAWPVMAATTPLPAPPSWIPLLSQPPAPTDLLLQATLVGVLAAGAVLGHRAN